MSKSLRDLKNSIESLKEEKYPKKKLELLEKSKQSNLITDDEYNHEKVKIEKEIAEFEKRQNPNENPSDGEPKKSDKSLIYGIVFILILFAAIFSYVYFFKEEPKTIEELHVLNLQGRLKHMK